MRESCERRPEYWIEAVGQDCEETSGLNGQIDGMRADVLIPAEALSFIESCDLFSRHV